jgi:hypothetical protein
MHHAVPTDSLFGWLVAGAGAGLFWEESTAGWLLVVGLFWDKITAGWWLISQANRAWSAMDRMEQYVRLGISEAPLAPSSFRSYKITGCLDHGWLETNFSNQSD